MKMDLETERWLVMERGGRLLSAGDTTMKLRMRLSQNTIELSPPLMSSTGRTPLIVALWWKRT
jgi:hypothetical protein